MGADGSAADTAAGTGSTGRANKRAKSDQGLQNGKASTAAAAVDEPAGGGKQDQQQQHPEPQQQQQHSRRRGDEEFELQLAMAMASTAAEAESRAAAAASAAAAGHASSTGRPPGRSLDNREPEAATATAHKASTPGNVSSKSHASANQSLTALIHKGVTPAALKSAAAAAAAKTPRGFLWQPNPGFVPRVWCEVYVGSSADGSWCHVDGLLGCHNQPCVVEAATARTLPLSYVVACQAGAPKDVTRR